MDPNQLPLRDLHLPDPTGWWPLAMGWWFIILLLVIGLVWLLRRAWRRRKFYAPMRYALREFDAIEVDYLRHRNAVVLGKQLSELLRRGMLAYAPRDEVAGLTGERWLEWLDRDLPVPYFHTEGGRSLLLLPYCDAQKAVGDIDINALLAAVKMRLGTPVRGLV
jgi:hypothetical protein